MIAAHLEKTLIAALASLLLASPAFAWITVPISQWPTAPSGKIYGKTFSQYGDSLKLELWRQEINGQPTLFMRGEGSALLCGNNFKIEQSGKRYGLEIRAKGDAFYDSYCSKPTQPVILLIDQPSSSENYDVSAAFRLVFRPLLDDLDYLDVEGYSSAGSTTVTSPPPAGGASTTSLTSSADTIFAWAEKKYPSLFPLPATAGILNGYTYRFYKGTGIYLATHNGRVIVHDGAKFNMVDVGAVTDFLALASAQAPQPPAPGSIPVGDYKCYAATGIYTSLTANVEILSSNTFRTGNSATYLYSYDASTGKIVWQDSMFKGMESKYFIDNNNKGQILILYRTAGALHGWDYHCAIQP